MTISVLATAERFPHATAVVCGDRELSYAELARAVAQRSAALAGAGTGRGVPRAVVATSTVDTVVTLHALIELGARIVLLHPRWNEAERRTACTLTDATPVAFGDAAPPTAAPADFDAVVFTSGSTGVPKGVILSATAFVASATASAENLPVTEGDRWYAPLPLSHVGGLSVLMRCALAGACVVLPGVGHYRAQDVARELAGATIASLVPAMLRDLLAGSEAPFPRLRAVLVGGAALSPALHRRAREAGLPVLRTYGMTEMCSQISTEGLGEATPPDCVGRPLPGVDVRIEDGIVQVRGPMAMTGYVGEPPHRGWLETRDRGELIDNFLYIRGRADQTIVTGGENVDPHEVECALDTIETIRESVVFGVPDERLGEAVAAALRVTADADLAAVAAVIATRLAPFKRPRYLAIVETLPRTPSGKVDRAAARETAKPHLSAVPYPKSRSVLAAQKP